MSAFDSLAVAALEPQTSWAIELRTPWLTASTRRSAWVVRAFTYRRQSHLRFAMQATQQV